MKKRNKNLEKLYSQETGIKKYKVSESKTVVVMPSPEVRRDLTDYSYGKDIDEKVVKLAMELAEKLAISMVREATGVNVSDIVDKVIAGVTERIELKLPEQQSIIREVVRESTPDIKKQAENDFSFDSPDVTIDRSKGLKIKGEIGKKSKKKGSLDEQLDALDDMFN